MANSSILFVVLVLFSLYSLLHGIPLSAKSRYVVDDKTGKRVKLVCANLVGHSEHLLPEGVNHQPVKEIARLTGLMGFNCIRLTYSVYMFTRKQNMIVAENLEKLGLHNAITGIALHNPHLLSLTLVQAQKAVVDEFSAGGIMTVLDNQVSEPMWCCGDNDGNGFFGDKYFDPQEWLKSLTIVANLYKDNPMVIGMSLRNELRGPNQNEEDWYEYMEKGAKAVHKANPNVLVIFGGISYAIRLDFLKIRPLKLHFRNKIMYEFHRYAFSDGNAKLFENEHQLNHVCQNIIQEVEDNAGFLSRGKTPAPIFVSEWGLNQVENQVSEKTFFACFLNYMADLDYEWGFWALQGDYIYRQGKPDLPEYFGMFNTNWTGVKNPVVNSQLALAMRTNRDPLSTHKPYHILFHPLAGKCLRVIEGNEILFIDCIGESMSRWDHVKHKKTASLRLQGKDGDGGCLTAAGEGLPVTITKDCTGPKSSWKKFNGYQLSYIDEDGVQMCLEYDPYYLPYDSSKIITRKCIVESDGINPQKQWFSLILSNVR